MPQKIKLHTVLLLSICFGFTMVYGQSNASTYDCLDIEYGELLKSSFNSFEKDLFLHYNNFDDPIHSYRKFLNEVYTLSLNLRKLPSSASISAAREFKKNAINKNALWVLLSNYGDLEADDTDAPSTAIKSGEDVLTFNYRGGFIQCLKNNSNSQKFKEIVTLLENDGNVSPSLIAQKLNHLPEEEFDSYEVKSFIAFDIYYSILMIIEKAFPK